MSVIDKLLDNLEDDEKEDYVVLLEDVLKISSGGNFNPNLAERVRLFFASDEDKIKALEQLNRLKKD